MYCKTNELPKVVLVSVGVGGVCGCESGAILLVMSLCVEKHAIQQANDLGIKPTTFWVCIFWPNYDQDQEDPSYGMNIINSWFPYQKIR